MVVTRIEGDAVGQRLMLRGFDADHGQDIELSVDGVPVNQPSHIHGQGYADLGFIIPETVRSLARGRGRVRSGAGRLRGRRQCRLRARRRAARHLAVHLRTVRSTPSASSPCGRPRAEPTRRFAAVTCARRAALVRTGRRPRARWWRRARSGGQQAPARSCTARRTATRARTANVLRRDDIESGESTSTTCTRCATAEAQHGSALRAQLGAKLRYRGDDGANGELVAVCVVQRLSSARQLHRLHRALADQPRVGRARRPDRAAERTTARSASRALSHGALHPEPLGRGHARARTDRTRRSASRKRRTCSRRRPTPPGIDASTPNVTAADLGRLPRPRRRVHALRAPQGWRARRPARLSGRRRAAELHPGLSDADASAGLSTQRGGHRGRSRAPWSR